MFVYEVMDESFIRETESKKPSTNYIVTFISIVPVISSVICAVYVIIMYSDIRLLITDFKSINNIISNINSTKIEGLINGIISLENCILNKYHICSA